MKHMMMSYLNLRKTLGVLAMLMPLVLVAGGLWSGDGVEISISAYYWTSAGTVFTALLVSFGIFLLIYHGYDKVDDIQTSIAGVAMIMVAVFPCTGGDRYLFSFIPAAVTNIIHYVTAAVAFGSLGAMSMFQFTKSTHGMTKNKKRRNAIYQICGAVIFLAMVILAITLIPRVRVLTDTIRLFLVLEIEIVWAFGISWLVKGEAILADD